MCEGETLNTFRAAICVAPVVCGASRAAYGVDMPDDSTPLLARRYIGETLQRMREQKNMTRGQVASELDKSTETIRRWENGEVVISQSFIKHMCEIYDASPAVMSQLRSMALKTKDPGLFEGRNVPAEARVLWESEVTAQLIRSVELENIPGLLQTPAYHQALQGALLPVSTDEAKAAREMRARRQQHLFDSHQLPAMQFIIGRAAIDYTAKHPDLHTEQTARLREVAGLPDVDIRVLADFHAGMLGSFTLITPRPSALGARPFVYIEAADGVRYEESRDVVSLYERIYSAVHESAIPLEEYLR